MDETDMELLIKLIPNGRMPYRELAESFQMSVAAVHKRIQQLLEEEVINGFKLAINSFFMGAFPVVIYGTIGKQKPIDYQKFLDSDNRNLQFIKAGAKKAYIIGLLKGMSEVNEYVDAVRRAFDLQDVTVMMDSNTAKSMDAIREMEFDERFHRNDLKILAELQQDPRAALSDVANKLGFTSKFVSRRVNRLLEQRWIGFTVSFNPSKSPMLTSILHIHFDDMAEVKQLPECLSKLPQHQLLQNIYFTNIPDMMIVTTSNKDSSGMRDLIKNIESCSEVIEVVPNIIYDYQEFKTWVDDSIREQLSETIK